MRKIIPLFLILIAVGGGAAAGYFLRPPPPENAEATEASATSEPDAAAQKAATATEEEVDPENVPDYVEMTDQFIIPIVKDEQIGSVVALSLSLEVKQGSSEQVFAREPRLRDEMLQLLFDYANAGGFDGNFTESENLVALRKGLLEIAVSVLGDLVSDVLITDIVRQDG